MPKHQNTNLEKSDKMGGDVRRVPAGLRPSDKELRSSETGVTEVKLGLAPESQAALLTGTKSDGQRAGLAMHLQRTYGNAYVQRLINNRPVQAKLTISQPSDQYEIEADRVADMVTRTPVPKVERQAAPEEEEDLQTKLQRQAAPEEEELQAKLHRQAALEEDEELQTKLARKTVDDSEVKTDSSRDVETRINAVRGGGQGLSESVRAAMEPKFGQDFSQVHVHAGPEADQLNRQLKAEAFTTGTDIFFKEGRYQPDSDDGKKLIAHELTHVVQQGLLPNEPSNKLTTQMKSPIDIPVGRRAELEPVVVPKLTEREKIDRALKTKAASDVKQIDNFTYADKNERMLLVDILTSQYWAGPLDEKCLCKIWDSFGDEVLKIAQENPKRWDECVSKGAELYKIGAVQNFTQVFQARAVTKAQDTLNISDNLVEAEREKYGISLSYIAFFKIGLSESKLGSMGISGMAENNASKGLTKAAKDMVTKLDEIDVLAKEKSRFEKAKYEHVDRARVQIGTEITDPVKHGEAAKLLQKAQMDYDLFRHEKETDYPILAAYTQMSSPRDALKKVAAGTSSVDARQQLAETIIERQRSINIVREALHRDPAKVWILKPIIQSAKDTMEISSGDIFDILVKQQQEKIESDELWVSMALAALGIGLGILAAVPTGGTSLGVAATAAGAVGSAAVSTVQAVQSFKEYELESAAAKTDFDKASAVSAEDPTLFWLALDIVGAVVDIHGAASVFKKMVTPAKAYFKAYGDAEEEALKQWRQAGKEAQTALNQEQIARMEPDKLKRFSQLAEENEQNLRRWKAKYKKISAEEMLEHVKAASSPVTVTPQQWNQAIITTNLPEGWMEGMKSGKISPELAQVLEGMREGLLRKLLKGGGKRTGSALAGSDFDVTFETYKQIREAEKILGDYFPGADSFKQAQKFLAVGFYVDPRNMLKFEEMPGKLGRIAMKKALDESNKYLKEGDEKAVKAILAEIAPQGKEAGIEALKKQVDELIPEFRKNPTLAMCEDITRRQIAINIMTPGAYSSIGAIKIFVAIRDGFVNSAVSFKESFNAVTEEFKRILPELKQELAAAHTAGKAEIAANKLREISKHTAKRTLMLEKLVLVSKERKAWGLKTHEGIINRAIKLTENTTALQSMARDPEKMGQFIADLEKAQSEAFEEFAAIDAIVWKRVEALGVRLGGDIPGVVSLVERKSPESEGAEL